MSCEHAYPGSCPTCTERELCGVYARLAAAERERTELLAENARLREALERVDALTRIDETPPPDHEEGDCIDCGARIDYEAGLEATEPERCNNCHAAWASLRMTDCGNIARAALAQAAGGETKETAR